MLFARNVQFQIKNDKQNEFTRHLNTNVLPLLKQQKGFKEELALLTGNRCMAISVWEDRGSAEAYQTSVYPKVVQELSTYIEGTPRVEVYDVALPGKTV